VIAAALTVPDFNQVFERANGRLLPFGWVKMLWKLPRIDQVRVGFLGVKPEYQHTGVAGLLYREHFDMAEKTPQTGGEMGWILETNTPMNRAMEGMGGKIAKRYRVYEKAFRDGE
jgi:GNAT superfamily N-acetyltransferase